ncbi:hypothetical protein C3747_72g117 [Trypanosoma cruzi]|uniref:SLACS reverse transcriptase n=1 Tax=Trypanosoma cruzi TaxID=5693 RepID=A0A2V2WNT8_TRYCR|nr:hypothetical protein C3747_72g117 [Trypanosoma cruzi]
MRTTPSAARPSYPPSMVTPHEAHCGVSQDSSWARRDWWAFTKKDNWSTRGSRCGECARAWCCDRSSSPSAPSPPSANWKAAFPTPASRRTWTTPRWRHHRACLGRCARRPPGRCVPWASRQTRTIRRSSTKEGPWTCPRNTFGRLPACSVREWQTTQRERADYAVCATQGGGNRPPVPSNCGAPFAKHTQWRLLSALPRVTFLLRKHAPVHTRAAAGWFDDRVAGVPGVIMDGPVTKRARDIATLPVRRGGCGLRSQREIAEFAYACLGEKGSNAP